MTGLVLTFRKPKRAKSVEAWKTDYVADDAPPGVYVPNMSYVATLLWKAKVVGSRSKCHKIEIRKTLGGTQVVVAVNGNMAHFKKPEGAPSHWKNREAQPHGVKISANGAMIFTSQEWISLNDAVREAKEVLRALDFPASTKATLSRIKCGEHPLSAPTDSL
jgi:hypothetical protein